MVVYMTLLTGTKDEDYEHGNSDLETDHRYELDWEPDEDDVKAELDELIAEEAEEDENLDTSEGYELEDDDGTVKTVTLLPSSTQGPITAAEHNLLEKLRSKTEFKESLVRGLIRFNHVIDRAVSSRNSIPYVIYATDSFSESNGCTRQRLQQQQQQHN
jgi:hypothetical protein